MLAKTLAEFVFGSSDALIQIDMSEYMEKFNVSRLIGSPPGYVGYEEGGQLTEKVRRRPYSVILFDEIEKAHPDIWNVLLQVLEDGVVTDSLARKIDFRNTIIIMTSNIGAENSQKGGLGFTSRKEEVTYEHMKERMLEAMKKNFRPEFLNRIDDLIVFRSLNKENMAKIVTLEVQKVTDRLKKRQLALRLDATAIDFLIEKGWDPQYGARPLRRAVEKNLEDPLAEEILKGTFSDVKTISVSLDAENKDKLLFTPDVDEEEKIEEPAILIEPVVEP
jgi:ATP-dependent Clp protease ATP-binding subunit ClpC